MEVAQGDSVSMPFLRQAVLARVNNVVPKTKENILISDANIAAAADAAAAAARSSASAKKKDDQKDKSEPIAASKLFPQANVFPPIGRRSSRHAQKEDDKPKQKVELTISSSEDEAPEKQQFDEEGEKLKKNLANKIFGYLARCEAKFCTTTLKN